MAGASSKSQDIGPQKGIPDEYEVLNRCGEGTFGQVFLCVNKAGKFVAIKTIKQEAAKQGSEGIPLTTIREAMLLRELYHPNILSLQQVFVSNTSSADFVVSLIFEFVDHDVHEIMRIHKGFLGSGPNQTASVQHLPPEMVRSLTWQLFSGLSYLHQNWIIHRDLKPSNLLVSCIEGDSPGRLKIADFGLARVFRKVGRPMCENGVVVTIWYRAPELLFGVKHYTAAVDMWAAGCVFGEFLTMSALFPGREVREPLDSFQADQMARIVQLLGTPSEAVWPGIARSPHWQTCSSAWTEFPVQRGDQLEKRLLSSNPALAKDPRWIDALDLLNKLLQWDPSTRLTAQEALQHPYFTNGPPPTECAFPEGFQPRYGSKTAHPPPTKKRGQGGASGDAAAAPTSKASAAKAAKRPAAARPVSGSGAAQVAASRASGAPAAGAGKKARGGASGKAGGASSGAQAGAGTGKPPRSDGGAVKRQKR